MEDLCFNTKALNFKEFQNIIFDILLPKLNPITIGSFYRPPNQANFMELLDKGFCHVYLEVNEVYLLSDFNINLLQNGKYNLNRKSSTACQGQVLTWINKYQEFVRYFL